jgi:hypothetical protein
MLVFVHKKSIELTFVGDIQLGEFTHKFESKYLDGFLGGTYADVPDVYRERSPVHHADRIVSPLLVRAGDMAVQWSVTILISREPVDSARLRRRRRAPATERGDRRSGEATGWRYRIHRVRG